MKRSIIGGLMVTFLLISSATWAADVGVTKMGLRACIEKALKVAPEQGEAQADIELATSKLDEAKAYRYPQIEARGLLGPAPRARGNQISSPDGNDDTDHPTWFARGDAMLIQPLYTFGKISENMKAATHGIEVDRAKKEQSRNEVALKVKEYYYGILLARELKEVVLEVKESLEKARDKAGKLLEAGSANVEQLDIYKLDAFHGEVDKYLAEAVKGETLALSALKTRLGLSTIAPIDIDAERLTLDEEKVLDYDTYVTQASDRRPEYRQVREGLKAREALVEAAKANYYPDLFVAGLLSAAYSPGRDRVDNPWIADEFNHFWAGAALGVRWKIDFGITKAKVAAETAQYNRLLSTKEYAEANIPLQIKKFYLELKEADKSVTATKEAYSNAKKWAVAAIANFDFGIGPAKEIFDSLQNYARMRAGYFQAIYNYNLAVANLSYATGAEPL